MVIATTMWDQVDPVTGQKRETELSSKEVFFKPVLSRGSRMSRHNCTVESAEAIVRQIIALHPMPLAIQREMVDEQKPLEETEAGLDLRVELEQMAQRHKEELDGLRRELAELKGYNAHYRQEVDDLKDAMMVVEKRLAHAESEQTKLKASRVEENGKDYEGVDPEKAEYDRTLVSFLWWLALR